jgi:hypothetical protein
VIVRAALVAVVSMAASCAAPASPATTMATTTPAEAPAAGGMVTPTGEPSPVIDAGAVAEALTLGATPCERDEDCELSGFSCSFCGRCPDSPLYGIHEIDLAETERRCEMPPEPAPCSPCEPPDPEFRQWTRVECLGGRCVPTTPGPPLGQ